MKDYKVIRCIGPCCENQGYIDTLQARIKALEKENKRLENITASGVHTCSSRCKRPACVMRRRIEALESAASDVVTARGKGVAQVHKDDVQWFMHLMNRIDALALAVMLETED